jgi:CPA2 family monovalent cation:H+ antiporter-2
MLERPGADKHRRAVTPFAGLHDHAILVGYGRVGGAIGPTLAAEKLPFVVIERDHLMLAAAQAQGVPTLEADAAAPGVLEAAGIEQARLVVVATPDGFQARRIVELARRLNPAVQVVVRTHSASEFKELEELGANRVVMGERELARGMTEFSLRSLGVPAERARAVAGRESPVNAEGT